MAPFSSSEEARQKRVYEGRWTRQRRAAGCTVCSIGCEMLLLSGSAHACPRAAPEGRGCPSGAGCPAASCTSLPGVKQGCEGLGAPLTQLEKPISFVRVPGVPAQPGWLVRPCEEPHVATACEIPGPSLGQTGCRALPPCAGRLLAPLKDFTLIRKDQNKTTEHYHIQH